MIRAVKLARLLVKGLELPTVVLLTDDLIVPQYDPNSDVIHISRSHGLMKPFLLLKDPVASVLHEFGHAFLAHRPQVCRRKRFKRLFGDVNEPYSSKEPILRPFKRYDKTSYVRSYSATHPEEDWADVFACVILEHSILRRGETLSAKADYVDEIIEEFS